MRIDLSEFFNNKKIHLFFDLAPEVDSLTMEDDSRTRVDTKDVPNESKVVRYSCADYDCRLTLSPYKQHTTLRFTLKRKDGGRFEIHSYGIKGTQELIDTLPYTARLRTMDWDFRETTNASTIAKPFLLYGSRKGENRFALGFNDLIMDTEKRVVFEVVEQDDRRSMLPRKGRKNVLTDKEVFSLTRPSDVGMETDVLEDSLFLSTSQESWFNVERDYCKWLNETGNYAANPFPDKLLGPAWCSWCFTTDIDEELIWENAKTAADLGCRFIIIDAGWYHRTSDLVWTNEEMTNSQIAYGRLIPDTTKFPDFRALIKRIKNDLDLGVALWIAPRFLFRPTTEGEGSLDPKLLDARIVLEGGKPRSLLCTRTPAAREHAASIVRNLLRDYDIDGIKIDAWGEAASPNSCHAKHPHDITHVGSGIEEWAKAIWESAKEEKRDFFVWLDTEGTKRYANYGSLHDEIWCNYDAHYIDNIASQAEGRGFPRQACDGGWHYRETDTNVAKHLAVYMCGLLPELDMDLTILNESHKRQIKAWFRFFEEHKTDMLTGEFQPMGFERNVNGPYSGSPLPVKISRGSRSYVWITPIGLRSLCLDNNCDSLVLFNLSNEDTLQIDIQGMKAYDYSIKIRDVYLEEVGQRNVKAGDLAELQLEVPEGGIVEIGTTTGIMRVGTTAAEDRHRS